MLIKPSGVKGSAAKVTYRSEKDAMSVPTQCGSQTWSQFTFNMLCQLRAFMHTLYLFTANDFHTFAIPTTLFATFGALSGPILTTNPNPSILEVLSKLPAALMIVWANLLIFDISNQRSPAAVEEDKINKPHRPLPSGRISIDATRRLLLVGIPVVLALSWSMGCWQEALLLFTATWMYNDLQGCDEDWILRNFLIAVGYGLFSSAALRVMTGPEHAITTKGLQWIALVTMVMFVTQHICDIKDAEGDRSRGRRSAPIVLGDELVRLSVALPIIICSIVCPAFFGLGIGSYTATVGLGGLVAGRTWMLRDLKSDKLTWKLWALWTVMLFALPLLKNPQVLASIFLTLLAKVCPTGNCAKSLNLVAVSSVALVVGGRKAYVQAGWSAFGAAANSTIPEIQIEGVM
ncbi:hypothetical protein BU24DRAFT_387164 [Aaosphaeria arxii CBS 175.79]|uniref:UbiA prenyltransferase n=1 Tax=Aaosphaeria arxii CBS 175.79 TaxID=1450172 RepID=A0A6A5Y404_9PLEO|nr:uncharacterized protein BU24DRAFT_387164 [Aaosphaeria arxii CBS 175.79]KAF2019986.1 hypothetical protein BU24DRAFT_387164 [Aaosphaeria arxii CBS 175.79]